MDGVEMASEMELRNRRMLNFNKLERVRLLVSAMQITVGISSGLDLTIRCSSLRSCLYRRRWKIKLIYRYLFKQALGNGWKYIGCECIG